MAIFERNSSTTNPNAQPHITAIQCDIFNGIITVELKQKVFTLFAFDDDIVCWIEIRFFIFIMINSFQAAIRIQWFE